MPPLMSGRRNSQHDRWEPHRSPEVNSSSFRITRFGMARHLERFGFVYPVSQRYLGRKTKVETDPTVESEEEPTQSNTSKAQERQERAQEDDMTKTRDQLEDADK
ncbi:hypothetical protein SARC_00322 [Sphaeroforma arctica JP610]|uniref:Uncharacterized protein n=1 Tax=Sphaeroforma arctica JP610 TaxID=667725 RepID=A0A0L0GEX4_9EUKA|nr:hypothetical protein SARC_00322 [Sphaeroforma arctica JP610]KNC87557.1 hypothetical protein SARC_00322 [Sphaeroforma arctica JP610]|eukprot:XP_014161459.1 hypothetical protein SARC_00322 [Sphaeroforma arctica JP610]